MKIEKGAIAPTFEATTSAGERISQTRGSCMQREQSVEIFNSDGLQASDKRNYIRALLTAIASDGGEQATGKACEQPLVPAPGYRGIGFVDRVHQLARC